MRSRALILFVLAGCSRNVAELREAKAGLEVQVADLKQKTTNLTGHRDALDALDQRLQAALSDAGVTLDALNVQPVDPAPSFEAQAPTLPALSVWEGAEARRLRVEIAELQARVHDFRLAAGEVDHINRRTLDIENALRAIDERRGDHTPLAPEPIRVVIFGGGTTRAAAEDALHDWQRVNASAGSLSAELAGGFPAIVSSDVLYGLKPGFELAVLGYCRPADFRAVLPGLRRLSGGVYGRAVALPDGGAPAPACPTVNGTTCNAACPDSCDAALRMVELNEALGSSVEKLRAFLPPQGDLDVHVVSAVGDVAEPQVNRRYTVSRRTLASSSLQDVAIDADSIDCGCDGSCGTLAGGWSASFDWARFGNQLYLTGVSVRAH